MAAKICFISSAIAWSGGTERVGTIIANSLCKKGYAVSILSFWNHGTPYYPLEKKVEVDFLLDPSKEGKLYRTYIYPVKKLHDYLVNKDIDIVIDIDTVHCYYTARAIKGTKCKLISWEHFNFWAMKRMGDKKRLKAKEFIKNRASALVVLTDEDRYKHIEEYNLPDKFVRTINNPCLSDVKADYSFDNNTFVSIGRLAPQKGYNLLLEAWNIVEKQIPDWKLVIVGDGELKEELLNQKDRLQLKNVSFTGHSDNVSKFYENSACYVMSSVYEGFPMVLLEAQSYGLPVISFDCKTGPRDLIDNEINGYLVEEANVEQLARMMVQFTRNRDKAYEMSQEALISVSKYGVEQITDQWIDLIESIL